MITVKASMNQSNGSILLVSSATCARNMKRPPFNHTYPIIYISYMEYSQVASINSKRWLSRHTLFTFPPISHEPGDELLFLSISSHRRLYYLLNRNNHFTSTA